MAPLWAIGVNNAADITLWARKIARCDDYSLPSGIPVIAASWMEACLLESTKASGRASFQPSSGRLCPCWRALWIPASDQSPASLWAKAFSGLLSSHMTDNGFPVRPHRFRCPLGLWPTGPATRAWNQASRSWAARCRWRSCRDNRRRNATPTWRDVRCPRLTTAVCTENLIRID